MPNAVKSAAPRRGDLVNDANAKLESYRRMLYPVALATIAGAGLGGLEQLYKHIEYDRFQPDEPAPDLEASQDQRRRAIERFRRESGAAWAEPKAAADEGGYDQLSWPQRLLIDKDEYNAAQPGMSKTKYQTEGPNFAKHLLTGVGMLGGSLLANQAIARFVERRRLRKSREEAMLAELEMRHFGEQAINSKRANTTDEKPNWVQRLLGPVGNAAWLATLGAAGAGALGGAVMTRNAFRDRKREYNADQIKAWMQDQRYKDFQDALTEDYLNETGDAAVEEEPKEAAWSGLLPFAKMAASANEGSWGQTIGSIAGSYAVKPILSVAGVTTGGATTALMAADTASELAGGPSLSGTLGHIGGAITNTSTNAISNIARGRGLSGMVTDNLDAAYENSDQMTRHKMTDTIGKAGENMGSAGGQIRKHMTRIAENPGFQRGLTGGASQALGVGGGDEKAAGFWENLKDEVSSGLSSAASGAWKGVKDTAKGVLEKGVNAAGDAAGSVWNGAKNLYQGASDAIGTVTGNADGEVIAKQVASRIPGQVAGQIGKLADKVESSDSAAEQVGRDMAAGRINTKAADEAAAVDNLKEYEEDVSEGLAHGVKSTVGGRMPNRASGAAVNLAINPNWDKGMIGMAGNALGLGQQKPAMSLLKFAAGNATMSHAFRQAGESIGKSPDINDPLAKALNDAVVPQVAQNAADKWVPQGSFGGMGDYANSAIKGIFAGDKQAGIAEYFMPPSFENAVRGYNGREAMGRDELKRKSLKYGMGSGAFGSLLDVAKAVYDRKKNPLSMLKLLRNAGIGFGVGGAIGGGMEYFGAPWAHSIGKMIGGK
jgi:hypothetical protein